MQILTVAAAVLALATPLVEAGSAVVYNKCSFNVYLWSVTADKGPGNAVVLAAGGRYSEAYQTPSKGGVSIKLSTTNSVVAPITQFEYTLAGMIWYDLSNVNCKGAACPFAPYGMSLKSGSGCPTVSCPGGEAICSGAYNNPDDNWASLACASSADTVVYLCAGSPSKKDEIPLLLADAPTEQSTTTLATSVSAAEATPTATDATPAAAEPTVQARAVHARHPHHRQ